MEPYGTRILIDPHGILWNPMESYGILWKPLESYGMLWNPIAFGNLWNPCESPEFLWNPMESYGLFCLPMSPYGLQRSLIIPIDISTKNVALQSRIIPA